MTQLVSQAEWARQQGFSRQYVSKLVRQGTIRLKDGKVDDAQAQTALAAIREPARSATPSPPPHKTSSDPLPSGNGQDLSTLLLKSRIKTEVERGKLLETKARLESGKLVEADEIRIAAFRKARVVRDGLLNLPERLAAVLAAESDANKVHELLTTEIRQVLTELSDDAGL